MQETLPQFSRESLTVRWHDEHINGSFIGRGVIDRTTEVVIKRSTASKSGPESEQDRGLTGIVFTDEIGCSRFKGELNLVNAAKIADYYATDSDATGRV